jgi:hypothetical protein
MLSISRRLSQLVAVASLGMLPILSCNSTEPAKVFLEIPVDSSWFAYDSIAIVLKNPETGKTLDTVFTGPVDDAKDLSRIPANEYRGEKVTVVVVGFKNGTVDKEESRLFDGEKNETIGKDSILHVNSKKLFLKPDSITLYRGGEAESVWIDPADDWKGFPISWKSLDSAKVRVSDRGVLTPVGVGATSIIASADDTTKDTVQVQVLLDPPVLDVGSADTLIVAGTPVDFKVTATQAYGFIKTFAWDLDGDGKFEDTLKNSPAGQTEFTAKPKTYARPESVLVRFLVVDGEGNTDTASRKVKVISGVNLKSLSLSSGPLIPAFHPDSLSYRAHFNGGNPNVTVFAKAEDPEASVSVNSGAAQPGSITLNIPLNEGTNQIQIKVVGEKGDSNRSYRITLTVPPNWESGL